MQSTRWSPAPWTSVGDSGPAQRTSDLSELVLEVVSRPGWASGNDMVFVITGNGKRVAEASDGSPAVAGADHRDTSDWYGADVDSVSLLHLRLHRDAEPPASSDGAEADRSKPVPRELSRRDRPGPVIALVGCDGSG